MDLTALPTDNLYKFMALAGTLLLVFSVYLGFTRYQKYWERLDELSLELAENEATIRRAEREVAAIEGKHDPSPEAAQALEERKFEARRRHELNKSRLAIVERTDRDRKWALGISIALAVAAVLLAGSGYYLWYDRLQRFQDRAVEAEAQNRPVEVPAR